MLCSKRSFGQAVIPCKDDAVLLQRKPDDLIVLESRFVQNIETQKPQSFRELAQHDVGNELHR